MSRRVFLVALALCACKSKEAEAPKVEAPAPAPPPVKVEAPIADKPWSDSTITFLEARGASCGWSRVDPITGRQRDLLTLAGTCEVVWAFSPDVKRGVVARKTEDTDIEVVLVDLETGKTDKAASPPKPGFAEIAFDKSGALIALIEERDEEGHRIPRVTEGDQEKFLVDGKRYDIAQDGIPGLAHAYRLEGTAWKKIETASSSYDWDYGAGVAALAINAELGVHAPMLGLGSSAGKQLPEESALAKKLDAGIGVSQGHEEGEWLEIGTGTTALYAWADAGEFIMATAELYRLQGDKALRFDLGIKAEQAVHYAPKGRLLLVNDFDGHAKLFDIKTGKAVLEKSGITEAIFWPSPR